MAAEAVTAVGNVSWRASVRRCWLLDEDDSNGCAAIRPFRVRWALAALAGVARLHRQMREAVLEGWAAGGGASAGRCGTSIALEDEAGRRKEAAKKEQGSKKRPAFYVQRGDRGGGGEAARIGSPSAIMLIKPF